MEVLVKIRPWLLYHRQWTQWIRVPELMWTFWRREKSLVPTGIQTMDHPAHTLVSLLTTLSWLCYRNHFVKRASFIHWTEWLFHVMHYQSKNITVNGKTVLFLTGCGLCCCSFLLFWDCLLIMTQGNLKISHQVSLMWHSVKTNDVI